MVGLLRNLLAKIDKRIHEIEKDEWWHIDQNFDDPSDAVIAFLKEVKKWVVDGLDGKDLGIEEIITVKKVCMLCTYFKIKCIPDRYDETLYHVQPYCYIKYKEECNEKFDERCFVNPFDRACSRFKLKRPLDILSEWE